MNDKRRSWIHCLKPPLVEKVVRGHGIEAWQKEAKRENRIIWGAVD